MEIKIYCIGKIKEDYFVKGINHFAKKASITIVEVEDEKAPEKLSDKEMENIKRVEGEKLLSKIGDDEYIVALTIDGKSVTEEYLKTIVNSHKKVGFIIGGSLGIGDNLLKRANCKISYSNMTFTHQMIRLILVESLGNIV